MAEIVIPPFVPSVVISENDLIADTDDKIITIMGEAGTYLQTQTQNASDTINSNVNKIFTATFQGTVGQTTTNLISGLITGGQTISVNCLVISENGILGRITEINDPNVIILWLQIITTTSVEKLVIEGTVDTIGELPTTASVGTAYAVGTVDPRDIYIYDTTDGWINQGNLKGIDGAQGENGIDGKSITSVTSSKVGTTTTVTIDGTFDNAPYSFDIEDGGGATGDFYTKAEIQTALPVIGLDATNTTPPPNAGQMAWNQAEMTIDINLGNGVTLQTGQEFLVPVRNNTSSIITNRTVCMVTGSIGSSGRITVAPMDGTVQTNADKIIGVATQDIAIGADGFVTMMGKIRGIDTSTLIDGDPIYVSTSTVGGITTTPPTSGMKLKIGYVVHAHTSGTLFIRVSILDENLYVKRITSTLNRLAKFSSTNGDLADSNLISNAGGDLGLNVSPSLWHSSVRALETLAGSIFNFAGTAFRMCQNVYYSVDEFYKYKTTAPATLYSQENGEHKFYTAPSGTAGESATMTEQLKIAVDGTPTFSKFPVTPSEAPTSDYQVANRKYVDDNIGTSSKPAFSATRLNASQALSSGVWTKVQLKDEELDAEGFFDSTTNYRYQPTVAGWYDLSWCVAFDGTHTSGYTRLYKNGSFLKFGNNNPFASTSATTSSVGSALVYLNGSTDYVELYGFAEGNSLLVALSSSPITFLSGKFMRS